MEVFTIDGRKVMQARKNEALLAYLGPEEKALTQEGIKQYSAFRFRKKTLSHVFYLNLMRRKRMLELISGSIGGILLN